MSSSSPQKSFTLYELMASVRRCIEASFTGKYWIRAESSDVRVAGGSGHCYLELLEKDENHNIRTKVRANIWRSTYLSITENFRRAGLAPLASGMSIMCLVQVQFHEQYGLSLVVHDIDPNYSLGEIERQRRETIARLKREGVFDDNKAIELPRPLQRLAIISSPTAAGYGDFMNHLKGNPYGFQFYTALFEAQMQGERTTPSVIAALGRIVNHADKFDAVVIIRGGGAVSELRAFDEYELCYFCTQFPLPIITGIGHERDRSVLDEVAQTSLKTPTAVAEFLIHSLLNEYSILENYTDRLRNAVNLYQVEAHRRLMEQSLRLPNVARRYLQYESLRQSKVRERLVISAKGILEHTRRKVEGIAIMLPFQVSKYQQAEGQRLNSIKQRLHSPLLRHRERYEADMGRYEQGIRLVHPKNILKRGFALVEQEGKLISDAQSLSSGDKLKIKLGTSEVGVTVD